MKVQFDVLYRNGVEKIYMVEMTQEKFGETVQRIKDGFQECASETDWSFGSGSSGTVIRLEEVIAVDFRIVE